MLKILLIIAIFLTFSKFSFANSQFEKESFPTSKGELEITFIGHGTLILSFQDKIIHIDPWTNLADYNELPKADIILLTHHHPDHLDINAINIIKKEDTVIVQNKDCLEIVGEGIVMKNSDTETVKDIPIKAVPAYNIQHKRDNGQPYHPKGMGNGYIVTLGELYIYIAGDTENIPEMKNIKNIDIAFLPMNLPFTMTPEMVADAAKTIKPKILYPYHYGSSDVNQLVELLKNEKYIEVRIKDMS